MPGQLALILHAHLPFVRHPEHAQFHEESWLFEAVAECYLPLLRIMDGWERDGLPWHLTLSVSPPVAAMLRDDLLAARFRRYLGDLRELAEKEEIRAHFEPARRATAAFYGEHLGELATQYAALGGDLVGAFARHAATGRLELITCSATHATLPLLLGEPGSLRAQLAVAMSEHARLFGTAPAGFWLPECAWAPDLEPHLLAAGVRWFVVETHGLLHAQPRPRQATFAPVLTPGGLAAFARDPGSARQVWSRHGGYPGDPRYREFHRDVAHDADWDYVRPYLHGAADRGFTGLKFHRVTGGGATAGTTEDKALYERAAALTAAQEHAAHFVAERAQLVTAASALMSRPPLVVMPYDAELFGHWWYEGPEFLDAVVRRVARGEDGLELTTPSRHLAAHPDLEVTMPAASTWGEGGHFGVWLDASNVWMQSPLRAAGQRMQRLAERFSSETPDLSSERQLQQAARELLLAQASDWPFLLKMGTAGTYPATRFRGHIEAFNRIATALETGAGFPAVFAELESRHTLFPDVAWRRFSGHVQSPCLGTRESAT